MKGREWRQAGVDTEWEGRAKGTGKGRQAKISSEGIPMESRGGTEQQEESGGGGCPRKALLEENPIPLSKKTYLSPK